MTYPVIPDGRAPMVATYRSEIERRDRLAAESLRRGVNPATPLPSVCRVQLNVNVALNANVDTYAHADWVVGEDPDGIFTVGGANPSTITVRNTGRYLVSARGIFTNAVSATTCAVFVTRNAASYNNSILRANANAATYGGDGTIVHGSRPVLLTAGDVLYWGHWSYSACTLNLANLNVPTEISITQIGNR